MAVDKDFAIIPKLGDESFIVHRQEVDDLAVLLLAGGTEYYQFLNQIRGGNPVALCQTIRWARHRSQLEGSYTLVIMLRLNYTTSCTYCENVVISLVTRACTK